MAFEIEIIKTLQSGKNDFFNVFFTGYAYLATIWSVLVLSVICFFCYNKKVSFAFLVTEGAAILTTYILKNVIQRQRPFVASTEVLNLGHETGYSLPSGHLTCAIVITIFLFYIAFRSFKTKGRIVTGVFACLFSLLMIIDRMYLGVHYLTDTLAGVAVGAVWCAIALVSLPPIGKWFDGVWAKIVEKYKQNKELKNKNEIEKQ